MSPALAVCAYILCAITSVVCACLLFRAWRRRNSEFLFWSALCFMGFAIDNGLLFYDLVIIPQTDLSVFRNLFTLICVSSLVWGLIIEVGE